MLARTSNVINEYIWFSIYTLPIQLSKQYSSLSERNVKRGAHNLIEGFSNLETGKSDIY